MSWKEKLKSRKLWLVIITIIYATSGWIIDQLTAYQAVKLILSAVGIYVGTEGIIDFAKFFLKKET